MHAVMATCAHMPALRPMTWNGRLRRYRLGKRDREQDMSENSRGASPLRAAAEPAAARVQDLGPMPVWSLGDLYPSPKSPAVQADLKKAADAALGIKQRYQGKLGDLAGDGT